jgi:hypothetical protein
MPIASPIARASSAENPPCSPTRFSVAYPDAEGEQPTARGGFNADVKPQLRPCRRDPHVSRTRYREELRWQSSPVSAYDELWPRVGHEPHPQEPALTDRFTSRVPGSARDLLRLRPPPPPSSSLGSEVSLGSRVLRQHTAWRRLWREGRA